ncbi:hypothetical protein ACQY0O_005054 [Thecaphora frezii]
MHRCRTLPINALPRQFNRSSPPPLAVTIPFGARASSPALLPPGYLAPVLETLFTSPILRSQPRRQSSSLTQQALPQLAFEASSPLALEDHPHQSSSDARCYLHVQPLPPAAATSGTETLALGPVFPGKPSPESSWQELLGLVSGSKGMGGRVEKLLLSDPFLSERSKARKERTSLGWRSLHGRLLYALLARRHAKILAQDQSDIEATPVQLQWDHSTAVAFHLMHNLVPRGSFQLQFLAHLADLSGRQARSTVIIHRATREVLSTPKWQKRLQVVDPPSTKAAASQIAASDTKAIRCAPSYVQLARVRRVYLSLMTAYARVSRFDLVHQCFDELIGTSVSPTIMHFQLELLATFARHLGGETATAESSGQAGTALVLRRLSEDVSQLRKLMEQHGVSLDDIFLAAIVHGLGSPLRDQQLRLLPGSTIAGFVQAYRSILDTFLDQDTVETNDALESEARNDRESAPSTMARYKLLSALMHVELDALRFRAEKGECDDFRRIQQLVQCASSMQSTAASATSTIKHVEVAAYETLAAHVQARTLADQGRLEAAVAALPDMLAKPASLADADPGPQLQYQLRDDIIKRRSIVILLFSRAISMRHHYKRHDLALKVLDTVVQHSSFTELWRDCIEPTRLDGRKHPDAWDPTYTLSRLWKRYLRAWSMDLIHGRSSNGPRSSRDPWKTLSNCIGCMQLMFGKLPYRESSPSFIATAGTSTATKFGFSARRRPFDILNERGLIRAMLHAAVVGGRWSNREVSGSTERLLARVGLVLKLFCQVDVRPWVWDLSWQILLDCGHEWGRTELSPEILERIRSLFHKHSNGHIGQPEEAEGEDRWKDEASV